jgi:exopolysaccharide production protein ExoQ
MPPILALWLGYGFIYWLFRADRKHRSMSSALLVPFFWLLIVASRPVSFWLSWIGLQTGGTSNLEGNPVDLVILLALMVAALVILARRGFSWTEFMGRNGLLILLYLFLLSSSMWAEHSFPTLKRVVKDFGSVIVALVILTEANPMQAIRTVFVRAAYVLFPLSIIFIKYYPSIGRIAGRTGDSMFCGVCMHKSSLGELAFILGLFLVVDLLGLAREGEAANSRVNRFIRYGLLLMGAWLVHTCASATALICFAIGCAILWGSGHLVRLQHPVRVLSYCAVLFVCLFTIEKAFDVSGMVLDALGKDRSLTGRTEIWELAKQSDTNVLLGVGYFSFWTSAAAASIQRHFAGAMNSAHNGFLDMYLDGGMIGISLLLLLMLVWGGRSIKRMLAGSVFGRLGFTIWVLAILFNHSETAFFRLMPMWFTLLVMMLRCPRPFDQHELGGVEEVLEREEWGDFHAEEEPKAVPA